MSDFDESKHPRDGEGKFTNKNGGESSNGIKEQIEWARKSGKELPLNNDGSLDEVALRKMYDERKPTDSDKKDSVPTFGSQEELDALLGEEFKGVKGQAAINKLLKEKRGHVKGAFHRDDIGDIDLLWGNDYLGLKHIIQQREKQGISVADFTHDLSDVIEKGQYHQKSERGNFEFIHNGKMVVVAPEYHGNKITFVLTAYKTRKSTV